MKNSALTLNTRRWIILILLVVLVAICFTAAVLSWNSLAQGDGVVYAYYSPVWSPDGNRLALVHCRKYVDRDFGKCSILYRVQELDSDWINLKGDNWSYSNTAPDWSPTGKYLAFASEREGNYEIYSLDTASKQEKRLTTNPTWDSMPSWSPDGWQIVFASLREGHFPELYIMDAEGREVALLTEDDNYTVLPAWSPSGNEIAFLRLNPGPFMTPLLFIDVLSIHSVSIINLDNNDLRDFRLPSLEYLSGSTKLMWSPDGSKIAFTTIKADNESRINLLNINDETIQTLATTTTTPYNVAWSPNSKYLAYAGQDGLHIIDTNVTSIRLVSAAQGMAPFWLSDNQVAYFEFSPATLRILNKPFLWSEPDAIPGGDVVTYQID
jgi:Tol biopolymer transport system component